MWPWRLKVQALLPTLLITNLNSEIHILLKLNLLLNLINKKTTHYAAVEFYTKLSAGSIKNCNYNNSIGNVKVLKTWVNSSFKLFSNSMLYNRKRIIRVHHTYNHDGIFNGSGNLGFTSVRSLFTLYKKFFYLMYSIIYYGISKLIFANNIFREESNALNWDHLSHHLFIWKYNYNSIFYKPSKLEDKLSTLFLLFKQVGITSGIVVDTLYHSKTIYYLHRFNFYSIGLVDAGKSKYTLNVSLPSLGENLTAHLFFVRSIVLLNKTILKN